VALNWIELAIVAIGGIVAGWLANSIYRRLHADRGSPTPPVSSGSEATDDVSGVVARKSTPSNIAPAKVSPEATAAGRIILHLYSLGRLGNDEVGLTGYTQRGMSEAIGIRQGTLTKVLTRLRAAKVVEVDRRHVRGEPRRLNVYRLTALGESVAKELRRSRGGYESGGVGFNPVTEDSRPILIGRSRR
jgi:DNA-binding MarR family transcriptional regulator